MLRFPRNASIMLLAFAFAFAAAVNGVSPPSTVLRSVRLDAASSGPPIVVIEATGPLPRPQVGVLDGPPRIYLDFPGVTAETSGTPPQADGLIRRVRVALHQPQPAVTRVVIDLTQTTTHRVDAEEREEGRIKIVIGIAPPPGTPAPVKASVSPPAPVKAPASPPAPSPAEDVAGRDRAVALAALEQLERMRPLLSSIDSRADMPEATLRAAITEFESLRQMVAPLRPQPSQEALTKVCVLGMTAAAARILAQNNADPSRAWNAASAAAGALIMLDRASSDLKPRNRSEPGRHESTL